MTHSFLSAEILEVIEESPKVKRMVLGFADELAFIPGQFITLKFPHLHDENGFEMERSYSVAKYKKSHIPGAVSIVEICFSLKPEGQVTPYLWQLSVGDKLLATAPKGDFVLRETKGLSAINFVCTGTGLVPFIPMIESLILSDFQGEIRLVIGNRYFGDVIYASLLKQWQQLKQVKVFLAFSREPSAEYVGYVHGVYGQFDLENSHVYVCGWKEMCADTRRNLKQMGLTRKQYFFEQYD